MASRQVLLLAVVVAAVASVASATQWIVGDEGGWRAKFNTTGWADGKTFVVGDTLMFMYPKDKHTVIQIGKDDFAACNLQGNMLGSWYSGNDVVPLDKPGRVWFFCSIPGHCDNGMKLVIDVVPVAAPAPAPWFRVPFFRPGASAPAPIAFGWDGPAPVQAPAPLPFGWDPPAPAPAPESPASPPSAAVRYPVGGAVAAAAAVVVAAVLAF